jgi:antitoxin Phd
LAAVNRGGANLPLSGQRFCHLACRMAILIAMQVVPIALPVPLPIPASLRVPAANDRTIAQARDQLPALVHQVERGRAVRLTRRGKAVAVLLSLREYERLLARKPDFVTAMDEFRGAHDLSSLDVEAVFAGVRDKSPGREVKW